MKKRRFLQAVGVLADANDLIRSPEAVAKPDPMISGLNILVVDDNIVNRRVCVAQLQKLGVRSVSEAEGGRQAIAAAQSQAFDLILMEVQMPVIDGLQATREIVGLTANALSEERERCLSAGMEDKLFKPVRIGELKEMLEAIGKIGPPDRPSSSPGSDLPVCDERQFNELLQADETEEFVTDVVQLFIEQAEQLASRLTELADTPHDLAAEVHKLKGAAGCVGAKCAAYSCGIVENAARLSRAPVDHGAVADLKDSLAVSVDEFRKRIKQQ